MELSKYKKLLKDRIKDNYKELKDRGYKIKKGEGYNGELEKLEIVDVITIMEYETLLWSLNTLDKKD